MSTGVGTLFFGERVDERFIQQNELIRPSSFDVLAGNAVSGLNRISPFQVARLAMINISPFLSGRASEPINSEEWLTSPYFREGIAFEPTMTKLKAFILSEEFDKERAWEEIRERGPQGLKGLALGITGELLGGVPDPLNFVPIIGHGRKLKIINRIAKTTRNVINNPARALDAGRLIGSGLAGGIDAAVATSLFTPLYLAERRAVQQEDHFGGMGGVLTNIAVASAIGGGAGIISNMIERKMKFSTFMKAQQRAVAQIADGKPVDVSDLVRVDLAENPNIKAGDLTENIRYDVAQDPLRLENKGIADDFNKFKGGIIPEEDITLPKHIKTVREQFAVPPKDLSRSLDTLETAGVPSQTLVKLARDPALVKTIADDVNLVEAISQMNASGVLVDDIAELVIANPKLLKEISNDWRRIRDISPTAKQLRERRVRVEKEVVVDLGAQRKDLEAKTPKQVNDIAKKEGIQLKLLVNRKKKTVIDAIMDKRRIDLGKPAEVTRFRKISDVVPDRKALPKKDIDSEKVTALISMKMRMQGEPKPGVTLKDAPQFLKQEFAKLDRVVSKALRQKNVAALRKEIVDISKKLKIDESVAEDLVKFEAARKGKILPGMSDTAPPANRSPNKLDDPASNVDRQLQEHLDTVSKIEGEITQEQNLLIKYMDCLET